MGFLKRLSTIVEKRGEDTEGAIAPNLDQDNLRMAMDYIMKTEGTHMSGEELIEKAIQYAVAFETVIEEVDKQISFWEQENEKREKRRRDKRKDSG